MASIDTTPSAATRDRFKPGSLQVDSGGLDDLLGAAQQKADVIHRGENWIFIHPDAVRDILVNQSANLGRSSTLLMARMTMGKGLITSDGELHRRQRPLIQPALHPKKVAAQTQLMIDHAEGMQSKWSDGQCVDVHSEMMRLTLRIISDALFGAAVGDEADALAKATELNVRAFRRAMRPGHHRFLVYLPSLQNIRYLLARRNIVQTLRRFIANRIHSGETRDDLLGRLLAASSTGSQAAMSPRQVLDECITLFAAGHETTASALTFTLWLLARHPHIQNQIQEELADVLPGGRPATPDDLASLSYTRMVVAESMRLFPPVWCQGRGVMTPCEIQGKSVPRGATVVVAQWATHRDPRWWPNPLRFDPLRFSAAQEASRPRWAYFPFGGGPRACVGEAFAWAETTLSLATMFRRWRFEPADSQPLRLEPGISLRPRDEVRMIVRINR